MQLLWGCVSVDEAAVICREGRTWKDLLSVAAPPRIEGSGSLKGVEVLELVKAVPLVCIGADLEKLGCAQAPLLCWWLLTM